MFQVKVAWLIRRHCCMYKQREHLDWIRRPHTQSLDLHCSLQLSIIHNAICVTHVTIYYGFLLNNIKAGISLLDLPTSPRELVQAIFPIQPVPWRPWISWLFAEYCRPSSTDVLNQIWHCITLNIPTAVCSASSSVCVRVRDIIQGNVPIGECGPNRGSRVWEMGHPSASTTSTRRTNSQITGWWQWREMVQIATWHGHDFNESARRKHSAARTLTRRWGTW